MVGAYSVGAVHELLKYKLLLCTLELPVSAREPISTCVTTNAKLKKKTSRACMYAARALGWTVPEV